MMLEAIVVPAEATPNPKPEAARAKDTPPENGAIPPRTQIPLKIPVPPPTIRVIPVSFETFLSCLADLRRLFDGSRLLFR